MKSLIAIYEASKKIDLSGKTVTVWDSHHQWSGSRKLEVDRYLRSGDVYNILWSVFDGSSNYEELSLRYKKTGSLEFKLKSEPEKSWTLDVNKDIFRSSKGQYTGIVKQEFGGPVNMINYIVNYFIKKGAKINTEVIR